MRLYIYLIIILIFPVSGFSATQSLIPLEKPHINIKDKASLQRGAKLYMNYCAGCHSLSYLRYSRMAKDIGIVNTKGEIYDTILKQNLIFTGAKISDAILSAMPEKDAESWFGVKAPDLTLVARVRGVDWIYTYLTSFYADAKRPLGVNNLVFPDVAMPNVLVSLQGIQVPIYKKETKIINGQPVKENVITHLALEQKGMMSQHEFNASVNDLVNFLSYASAPEKLAR